MFSAMSRTRPRSCALRNIPLLSQPRTTPQTKLGPNIVMSRLKGGSGIATLPATYREDRSQGPMLRWQASLPHLPVPTLENTAARYLKSLLPLLTPHQFRASVAAVEAFIAPEGPGRQLQERLVARREDPSVVNWLYDWWNEAAYLAYREPVVPYVSYFYSHRDDRLRRQPARRAAAIATAALAFKARVDGARLEPDTMRHKPLCMDSYKWMFNASRVAARPFDYPVKSDPADPAHKHLLVLRKNKLFRIAQESAGVPLNTSELQRQFERVYELAAADRGPAVGALTSEHRDVWADARAALLAADPARNAAAMHAVESASFVVCLDDAAPVTLEERAHAYWHGDGQNRWYDKPLQFIVNDNGTSGFMGEHSMMDGTPTHRLNDYVCDAILNNRLDLSDAAIREGLPDPEPVEFVLNPQVEAEIARATRDFAAVVGQHELAVQAFQGYGKGLIKQFNCSPDAYVQMAIQLAYHKMHGTCRPTYESAATRRFALGRTETCRSVSAESVAWCAAMARVAGGRDYNSKGEEDLARLFHAALDAHVKYITVASDGQGVDRHLFGLRRLVQPGEEVPALYTDPAYAYSSSWYLSTSQLSSEHFNGYGWSQVIDGGFGIAYMINENSINFNIVSKKLGSARMSFYLNEALQDMADMLRLATAAPGAIKAKL